MGLNIRSGDTEIEFIKLIEEIGFVPSDEKLIYTYKDYNIKIIPFFKYLEYKRWSLLKNGMELALENNKRLFFQINEIDLLKSHFKSELRNKKLQKLGI